MKFILSKMKVEQPSNVQYTLRDENNSVLMNSLIGKELTLTHTENKYCSVCDSKVKKFFGQGFCYPCFAKAPENSECIIRPELCKGHQGEGRDPEWEERNHNQPHVVYLAIASGIKVGVTRETQVPYRWIDQGASRAVKIAVTENRYQAGMMEVALKEFASDKTHWQRMLKNEVATDIDIIEAKDLLIDKLDEEFMELVSDDDEVTELNYPSIRFPEKVKSHNLDKEPIIEGTLEAIKGQYLLFEGGKVINIRKYGGYFVEIEVQA